LKKKVVTTMALAAVASGAYAASASASTYSVQKGDTLTAIASKYQTSVVDLKTLNNLASDLIRVSQTLQIPDGAAAPTVQASAPAPTSAYTVVKGDTLSAIARRNNISLTDLRQWNNLSGDLIIPGQQLKVANGTSTQTATAAQPQAAAASSSTSDYVIQSGDTLSKIAKQFGTSVTTLQQLNGLSSDRIYAGQSLKVSGSAPAPAPTPAQAVAPAAPAVQASSSTYTVQSGDTLSKIARQFSTSVDTLMQLNGLSSTVIYVGQTLAVSGQPASSSTPLNVTKVSTSADTSNSQIAAQVTLIAKSLVGSKYVWGGNTTAGFDCSGFIYYVFNKAGLSIARYSADGYANRSYEVTNPVPGDLVFFSNTYTTGISHVGIYLGGDSFVQAADEIHGVIISSLSNSYYKKHFDHFARFY
jgi:LysM repeat protein